jgi:hypothetical protein
MLNVVHDEAEPNEASGSVLDEIVTGWWSATVITTNAR